LRGWVAATLLACVPATALADEAPAFWYLQIDNDVAFHTDRWYTSGVRIARVQPEGARAWEFGLVQEIYTPEAERFVPGTMDRAPAARLMLSGARHETGPACLQTIEIGVGVNGPAALGEQAQNIVHKVVPGPEVDWDRQQGNRADVQVTYSRSDRFSEVTLNYGAVLGTVRSFAHAGAQLNMGVPIATPLLRFAPTPPQLRGLTGWGGFAGVSARAVANDRLLDTGYDETLGAPSRKRVVGRFAGGVGLAERWGSVSLTLAIDSREFAEQRVAQPFGSLLVHLDF
jgi:lipid A 3-O-deacylase